MKALHILIPQVDVRVQAYVENLEKEVRRLVDENLKLKKQCKEVLNHACPMPCLLLSISVL
jgi:hypothetical protein